MIHDLHSHTSYSFCGKDELHALCEGVINGGVDVLGISDHNYGITRSGDMGDLRKYFEHLTEIRDEYKGRLRVLRGLELNTLPDVTVPYDVDLSYFDYVLLENCEDDPSVVNDHGGIVEYARHIGTKCGMPHMDLFGYMERTGKDAETFIKSLADAGIFWELNVNCDSIHGYSEHEYVKRFMASAEQQDIVRRAGLEISVGFDGHRVNEYKGHRVIKACEFIKEAGLREVEL